MKATEQVCIATRQRLLEAAGEVFADQGFRAATIREICNKAGANIAAVNYHFGDKRKLYAEVLKYAYERSRTRFPLDMVQRPDATPQRRLAGFARALVLRILDRDRLAWQGTLMFREMIEPTEALRSVVEEGIRPEFELLRSIVTDLLGVEADDERVLQCVWSIAGQGLFHYYARHIVGMLRPAGPYSDEDVQRIADHVTLFSLAAIQCIRDKKVK